MSNDLAITSNERLLFKILQSWGHGELIIPPTLPSLHAFCTKWTTMQLKLALVRWPMKIKGTDWETSTPLPLPPLPQYYWQHLHGELWLQQVNFQWDRQNCMCRNYSDQGQDADPVLFIQVTKVAWLNEVSRKALPPPTLITPCNCFSIVLPL